MPLLDRQRRGYQIGEIRLGTRIQTNNGKFRPSKLNAFRFTTRSESVATAVAEAYGAEARQTKLANDVTTWEVMTDRTEIPVIIPPGEQAISQWYELWSAEGCQRRCDGETEQRSQEACKCPADLFRRSELAAKGGACKPTTRINVILPDLPGLGVWKIESHGNNAADEQAGTIETLAAAQAKGIHIPATVRLEQRVSGKNQFVVPVVDVTSTLRELMELDAGSSSLRAAIGAAPAEQMTAIEAPKDGPVPVDMRTWINNTVTDPEDAEKLKKAWSAKFDFSGRLVPPAEVGNVEDFVRSFVSQPEDEPIDAEVVEDDLDPGRNF